MSGYDKCDDAWAVVPPKNVFQDIANKQQACINSFYESTPGKVVEFGSVLSMAPG